MVHNYQEPGQEAEIIEWGQYWVNYIQQGGSHKNNPDTNETSPTCTDSWSMQMLRLTFQISTSVVKYTADCSEEHRAWTKMLELSVK